MPTRVKTPLEVKRYPINMDELIPTGAVLQTVQGFASRQPSITAPLQSTQLDDPVAVGATTINLKADPKAGALLIIEPGSGQEERVKVISVTGAVAPFIATVTPGTWYSHADNAAVSYEPGYTARLFANATPTPSGVNVTLTLQKGCDGQKYSISLIGVLNNGEIREDEFDLEVTDVPPTDTRIKQPAETCDLLADFEKLLGEPHQTGSTLMSAIAFASSVTAGSNTTLAVQANPEDATLSLVAHPGIGALLVVDPTGMAERVYVSAVSGSGPFVATIHPTIEALHGAGITVNVFTGVTANFLTSPTSTIQSLGAVNRARGGPSGKNLKVVWRATTSLSEQLQLGGIVSIQEL